MLNCFCCWTDSLVCVRSLRFFFRALEPLLILEVVTSSRNLLWRKQSVTSTIGKRCIFLEESVTESEYLGSAAYGNINHMWEGCTWFFSTSQEVGLDLCKCCCIWGYNVALWYGSEVLDVKEVSVSKKHLATSGYWLNLWVLSYGQIVRLCFFL